MVIFFVFGAHASIWGTTSATIRQRAVPLPLQGRVSSVNLPIIQTGGVQTPTADNAAVPDQDVADQAGTSSVATFEGQVDVALQLLEQSPPGAHLDWAIFMDLSEAYDAQLETNLISGIDGTSNQLLGVTQVSGVNTVTYTDGTPKGSAMWPFFGQGAAQIGNQRQKPPECWLMRTARWFWLQSQEDTATLPFGIFSPFFLGNDDDTPDPIGGLQGLPVFLDDAIASNLTGNPGSFGTGGTQDAVICLRPSDLILLEGDAQTMVAREPLSGSLGARIQMHGRAAAITGRRPAGITVLGGTGFAVQTGYR